MSIQEMASIYKECKGKTGQQLKDAVEQVVSRRWDTQEKHATLRQELPRSVWIMQGYTDAFLVKKGEVVEKGDDRDDDDIALAAKTHTRTPRR